MNSRYTGTANAAHSQTLRRRRSMLLLGTALAASASPAFATITNTPASGTSVISGNETVVNINNGVTGIAGAETTISNLTVTFDGTAVVDAASGQIFIDDAGVGKGDGAIVFVNNGLIGKVATSTVVDVHIHGASGKSNTTNTLDFTNNGTINGFVSIGDTFGESYGKTTLTNTGKIYGGTFAGSYGDTLINTTATGQILGSFVGFGAQAVAFQTATTPAANTTALTSGTATVQQDGDAVTSGGTRLDLLATSGNVAVVNVKAKAGNVIADATGSKGFFVFGADRTDYSVTAPFALSVTTVTNDKSTTYSGGKASVVIDAKGDVTSAQAYGVLSADVKALAGSTIGAGGITANSSLFNSSTKTTQTGGTTKLIQQIVANTKDTGLGSASISVAAGVKVAGGGLTATGGTTATITSAGDVTGSVTATANGVKTADLTTTNYDPTTGALIDTTFSSTTTPTAGAASITLNADVTTGNAATGDVKAISNGPGGATVSIASGVVGSTTVGGVILAQSAATSQQLDTYGNVVTGNSSSTDKQAAVGGAAKVDIVTNVTVGGKVDVTGDGGATLNNVGQIGASANVTAQRVLTTLKVTSVSTLPAGTTTTTNTKTDEAVGGAATLKNDDGGVIVGNANVIGLGDVNVINAGVIQGTVFAASVGQKVYHNDTKVVTVTVAAPNTTTQTKYSQDDNVTTLGGNATSTISGSTGVGAGVGNGTVTQIANKASTVTVSGAIYGNLVSKGGFLGDGKTVASNSTQHVEYINTKTVETATPTGIGTEAGGKPLPRVRCLALVEPAL